MGCDIHLTVERRVNEEWTRVDELPARPCSWCKGSGKTARIEPCPGCSGAGQQTSAYDDRNYKLFSVLADVRNNGYVKPIAEPRGLPSDATADAESEHGDHSFSWLTLRELQSYDWSQPIDDEGFVEAKVFAEWDKNGRGMPSTWSQMIGGSSVEHVTHNAIRRYIADGYVGGVEAFFGVKTYVTLVQWRLSLIEYCRDFLTFMESLSGLGEPDDVRIVFGFDS